MPTRNVNLTDYFDQFIETGITSGRFSNASEVVREGLRLLDQREKEDRARIEWLRAAAEEGFEAFDRGDYTGLSSTREIDTFFNDIHKEVFSESAVEREGRGTAGPKKGFSPSVGGRDAAPVLRSPQLRKRG